ncbi:S-layer homology domain-containing protein [Paenibacillus sp. MMS20-IR301]|uniref:S-layer homology domain-containing protein n=1 Tax=Paenibacillus sp. MMS20-IR301 TaxID=2895946 RepID=UPI0028EFDC10|nr:S-layer homology domain-containing protein [Paenibacillus sp. MMS20-IR301]WNS41488.1 S-layer homology domain-containing protein [Paenibacillus sp. MMS20-IR301]
MTGYFNGNVKFDGINTVADPNTGTAGSIFIAKYASDGTLTWVKVIGSVKSASSYGDFGRGIAVDSSGNVYVAAQFMGDGTTGLLDVDPDPGVTKNIQGETSNSQAFLLKLNSSGAFQWVVTNRGPLSTAPYDAVAINSAGTSIYWGGAFTSNSGKANTVTDGTGVISTQSASTNNLFVMKINAATGALTWFTANPTDPSANYIYSLALDSNEDVYAAGNVYGGPTFGSTTFENTGTFNSFVWKLNSSGVTQWADQFKSSSTSNARGVTADSTGVYVTGFFQGTNDFDPGPGTSNATSAGANDMYVVKLNPSDGALLWKFTGGGTAGEIGSNLNVDGSGNLYVLGTFNGTAAFGSTNVTSVGNTDLFILKLSSSNGSPQWVNTIGSTAADAAGGIAIYSNGNIRVGATIKGIADVDPSGATLNATNNSGTNSAIASVTWNSSGQLPSGATAPTVITSSSVSGITGSAATIGGNVTADGGTTITERGVVYSVSANPTTSDSKVTASGTTGTFSVNLSALNANTTYHFRAYAKNSQGTSYGSNQTFTTTAMNSSISPAVASFDKKTTAQADVTTTMTLNGNTLSSIQNGASTLMLNTDYTVSGSTVTIKKEYLAAQSEGTTSLTINFNAGNTQTLAITVTDTTPTPEAIPAAAIGYEAEQLTGLIENGVYTVNGTTVTADSAGKLAIDSSWLGTTLSIVKKGNGTTTSDSVAQSLPVPSRPVAPAGVGKTDETTVNGHDGSLTGVNATMEYKLSTAETWSNITGTSVTGLVPGTYDVRTKATLSSFASSAVQVTVGTFTATPEAIPTAAIDYTAEQLSGLTASGVYTVNGTTVTADSAGKLAIDSSWLGTTLSIVKKGNGTTTSDSAAQSLPVPSRPVAPAGVGKTDETTVNGHDGSLTGVNATMEYKLSTAETWSNITGTSVTGLVPGTYDVRTKATSSSFASSAVQATVGAFTATPEAIPAAAINYEAEQLTGLSANGTYTVNGTTVTATADGKISIDSSWLGTTLSIVKKGNGTTTSDGAAQSLPVPSRPAAPAGVGKTDETTVNGHNGSLTGVNAAMEYKLSTAEAWSNITGTSVTGLVPDTYDVRTKATSSSFASAAVQVTVGAFTATPETIPAAAINYEAEQLTGLTANGTYTVNGTTVTADSAGKLAIDSSWLGTTLSIVKKGNGTTTSDSTAQSLPVAGRPAAPAGVGKTDETTVNGHDGSLTGVNATMEYKLSTAETWSNITGTSVTGLAPGTYDVRTKATSSSFASAAVQVTVGVFTATPEAIPAAAIDYEAEQLTGLSANGTYTVNGTAVTADSAGKLAIDSGWLGTTLSIVKKGNGTTTSDSAAQSLPVPSRPAAPAGVGKTDETTVNGIDGILTGVNAAMEYKLSTAATWSDITGTSVTGLAPGTYDVRTKATSSSFASAAVQVTVGAFTATPEAIPAAAIGYEAEQLTGLTANGTYTVNGTAVTATAEGKISIDSGWLGTTLSIVKKGNGTTTSDSAAQSLPVPSRPVAPAGVGKTDETTVNGHDGSLTGVNATMEYKLSTAEAWSNITGTSVTGLAPGTYDVRTKATSSSFTSAAVQVTVGVFTATPEAIPAAAIGYEAEQLTGLTANGVYTVNGTTVTATAEGKISIDSSWLGTTLSIVKMGDGSTTTDSAVQTLSIPSRAAAPVGVTVTDVTYGGANNGSIQNVTLQMEYKKGSTGSWTDVEDTVIVNLAPDTYYVRVKATSTSFASIEVQVTVHDSDAVIPAAPEVTADDQSNRVVGLNTSMEFAVDDGPYVRYDGTNLPDLSGEHTVKVRVAASGSVPAGPATTITFTTNAPIPAAGLTVSSNDPVGTANNGMTQIVVTPAPAEGHEILYKNFGTGSVVIPNAGDTLTGYTVIGSAGLIPASNGDKIGIAEVDAAGKVVKYGIAIAAVLNDTITPDTGNTGNTGNSSSSGTAMTSTSVVTNIIVLVNGKEENAGQATITTNGNVKTTTIAVDPVKLQAKLDAEGRGAVVTIPVTIDSNVFVGELNGQMVKNLENASATLVLQTNTGSYTLPAKEINIGALAGQLGNSIKLEDIKLKITIAEDSAVMKQVVADAISKGGYTLVAPSVDFTVTATYGTSTVEVGRFNVYVQRSVALPDGVDPNRITTGIVVEPDGTVRHVPTRIMQKNGRYYAEINSLTNSSYSVVWHPLTFADVENHWAKDAVNDMGSRLVINGVNQTAFNPNADITRAEFAAIIVRGLGLKLGDGQAAYADVPASAWYAGAVQTAAGYGLITGFEDGTFRPDALITREQAMNIIAKAMKLTGLAELTGTVDTASVLGAFTDGGNAGSWAKDSLALAAKAGLITGRGNSSLAAKANVTRAEVAALIQRLLQKSDLIN